MLYSLFGVLTVFGTGNATQVNTIITAIDAGAEQYAVVERSSYARQPGHRHCVAMLVALVLLGGIKRIGSVSEKLVPFMALLYVVLALAWWCSQHAASSGGVHLHRCGRV